MATNNISQLAHVHPEAQIGQGVTIASFAVVEENTVIGDGCVIDSGAIIRSGARLGRNCHIHPGAVIAGIPQDLKFAGEETVAILGDGVQVRECVTVNRGTASRGKTVVGNNCLLMAYCHVAHDCVIGNNVIIGNATQLAGEVEVDDFAIISGGSLAHQFVRIGCHVMVQGGSRIGKDVPPYSMVGREPLIYSGLNIVGLRRRGFTREQIERISEVYRIIYQSGLNTTNALNRTETELQSSPERDIILSFIRASERGIVKGGID